MGDYETIWLFSYLPTWPLCYTHAEETEIIDELAHCAGAY